MIPRQSGKRRGILPGILAGALVCVFAAGMLFSAAAQIQNYESGGIIDMDGKESRRKIPAKRRSGRSRDFTTISARNSDSTASSAGPRIGQRRTVNSYLA